MIPIYLAVFLVAYWIFNTLTTTKKNKSSVLANYVEKAKQAEKKKLQDYIFAPLQNLSGKYMTKEKQGKLLIQLEAAALEITPEKFMQMKLGYPVFFCIAFIIASTLSNNILMNLGIIGSWLLYFYPDFLLKKKLKVAEMQRKLELPELLIPLSQLLKTHTTIDAVRKVEPFTDVYLRPYVKKLLAELEAFPSSDMPFKNFAESVNLPEVHTFVIALQQSIKVDKKQSIEILNSQIQMLREMKVENYNYLIQNKPIEMNKFNVALIGSMVVYPLVLVMLALIEGFSTM